MLPCRVMIVAAIACMVPSVLAADGRALRVGGFLVAPMVRGEAGTPIYGALPEYLKKQVAEPIGVRLVFEPPMSFPRSKQALREGTLDMVFILGDHGNISGAQRATWTWLEPLSVLAVPNNSKLHSITDLAQLTGLRIGWVGGSQLPPELKPIAIDCQFMYAANWQAANLKKLAAGRLDAVFFQNPYSPEYWARKENLAVRLIPLPLPPQRFEFGYGVHANPALIREFDRAAEAAFKGERFQQYLKAWRD